MRPSLPGNSYGSAPLRLHILPVSLDSSGEESGDSDATPVVREQSAWRHAQRLPFGGTGGRRAWGESDAQLESDACESGEEHDDEGDDGEEEEGSASVASEQEEMGNYSPIQAARQSMISDNDLNNLSEALQLVYEDVTLTAQQHFLQLKQRLLKEKEAVLHQRDEMFLEHSKRYQSQIEELQERLRTTDGDHQNLSDRYEHVCVQVAAGRSTLKRLSNRQPCYETALMTWRDYQQRYRRYRRSQNVGKQMHTRRTLAKAFAHLKNAAHRSVLKSQSKKSEEQLHAVSKDLITRYEARIQELTTLLHASEARCLAVQRSRAQLEEDLRRTFLKGMSVMNLEALTLFQSSKAALQQQPQQRSQQQSQAASSQEQPSTHAPSPAAAEHAPIPQPLPQYQHMRGISEDNDEIPRQAPPPTPST